MLNKLHNEDSFSTQHCPVVSFILVIYSDLVMTFKGRNMSLFMKRVVALIMVGDVLKRTVFIIEFMISCIISILTLWRRNYVFNFSTSCI